MVTVLAVTLALCGWIEPKSCALLLGFDLGYSFGEVEGWADRIAKRVAVVFQRE